MTEQLRKSRDLVTWLVIGGFALYVLVELIRMIVSGTQYGFIAALSGYGSALVAPIFVIALTALLIWAAVDHPAGGLRTQALIGLIVTAVAGGLGLLSALIGIFDFGHIGSGLLGFFLAVAYVALSVAAILLELRIVAAAPRPQPAQAPAGPWGPGAPGQLPPGQFQQGQFQQGQSQPGQPQPGQPGAQGGWQPQPAPGYPQGQPSAGYPQGQPSAGYPQGQPSAGYPQGQPSAGYPQGQPSAAPAQEPGPGGYPPPQAGGYPPQQQGGYPQQQPPVEQTPPYEQAPQGQYAPQPPPGEYAPEQPAHEPYGGDAQSGTAPAWGQEASGWDEGADDRTRLVPRVGAPEQSAPEGSPEPSAQPEPSAPEWGPPAEEPSEPDHGQWAPRSDPTAGQG